MVELSSKSGSDPHSETESLDSPSVSWRILMRSPYWRPPTDVYETEMNVVVRVEIPGMREQDFFIELNGRELSIRGSRQDTTERRAFHQMEIRFGEFAFSVELPSHIATEGVEALYQNGFLIVSLPKTQPRTIQIGD